MGLGRLQVFVVRLAAELEKASLTACPATWSEATAINEIKTKSNAYSVKSWPSSSFQSLFRTTFIGGPLGFVVFGARKIAGTFAINA
jgi:hypothetical protein